MWRIATDIAQEDLDRLGLLIEQRQFELLPKGMEDGCAAGGAV
ncbi:MAG: hypothetical protein ACLTLE_03865 [Lachnospiraceae bacterium]